MGNPYDRYEFESKDVHESCGYVRGSMACGISHESPARSPFAGPWTLDRTTGEWFRVIWEEHREFGIVKGIWRGPKVTAVSVLEMESE